MKSVLVVGAGPAGLVTAKTLLQRVGDPFKVTVFEASDRVGGMWRPKQGDEGDKCSPEMRTNLSRFTVAFSDLPWPSPANAPSKSRPIFPKAHEVGSYLQEYASKFIPEGVILGNREVQAASLIGETPRRWRVASLDKVTNTTHEDLFDYLIVASGFFDRPSGSLFSKDSDNKRLSIPVQHSSKFRNVSTLANSPGNIVVIGGGISGSEAAATAASQISNAKYAPGKTKPAYAESKIYHVFDRPFYCLPRYLPRDPYDTSIQDYTHSPTFLPLDLVLYNLSRRGGGPISASNGQVPAEKAKKGHEFIRSMIGGDQRELGRPELVYRPQQTEFPAFTGISDTYAEYVRSGLIVPVQGRAVGVSDAESKTTVQVLQKGFWAASAQASNEGTQYTIDNVTGIIEATGFQVHLGYLSDSVKEAIGYDAESHRVPFLLSRGSIRNPAVPELAFVGFYEGPFWGVMEMQARLISQILDTRDPSLESLSAVTIDTDESKQVREAIRRRDLDVPQFWMPDYVGLIEEFSRLAGIDRDDTGFDGQLGPAFAARYAGDGAAREAARSVLQEVRSLLDESGNEGRFVAAAAFRAMQGTWTLQRKIDSRNASSPGGTLAGTASFHPRSPTSPNAASEYLYIESGTFTMDNGFAFPASRRYIYRYDETDDSISTYFVQEDGESADKIFNELVFEKPDSVEKGWIAKSKHWCSPDQYNSRCEFRFRAANLESFGITYDVKGPNKDYTHESWYRRPTPGM